MPKSLAKRRPNFVNGHQRKLLALATMSLLLGIAVYVDATRLLKITSYSQLILVSKLLDQAAVGKRF